MAVWRQSLNRMGLPVRAVPTDPNAELPGAPAKQNIGFSIKNTLKTMLSDTENPHRFGWCPIEHHNCGRSRSYLDVFVIVYDGVTLNISMIRADRTNLNFAQMFVKFQFLAERVSPMCDRSIHSPCISNAVNSVRRTMIIKHNHTTDMFPYSYSP